MYEPLTRQQSLVLREIYLSIPASLGGRLVGNNYRRDLAQVLGKVHCCPGCTCSYFNAENRSLIETRFAEADQSGKFTKIFVGWNTDGTALAMFGVLKENPTASVVAKLFSDENPLALLGEWVINGSLPSFEDRLERAKKTYRSFWIGRVIIAFIAAFGLFLLLPALAKFGYPVAFEKQPSSFLGAILMVIALTSAYFSAQKYRVLFRR
jgi:hypothetical protein